MHCLGGLEHKTTHFRRQILQNYPERAHSFADNFEASVFALSQCTVPACYPSPPTLQSKTLLWTTLKSVLTRGRKYFQKRRKKWRNVHGKTLRSLPRLFLKRAHRRCCCWRSRLHLYVTFLCVLSAEYIIGVCTPHKHSGEL